MTFTPRKIIFLVVSQYLTDATSEIILTEICKQRRLSDNTFIKIIEKYFDFKTLRDKPIIKEDIWIFNYLMYQVNHKGNFNPLNSGEEISLRGRLPKKGLIIKYEKQIILPQYKVLASAKEILQII
ncbi:MAG: hypothetical protein KF900_06935 [Bacteroidetes bacterium]|nr:hypothetical protein [Bacteroidota bacterium]